MPDLEDKEGEVSYQPRSVHLLVTLIMIQTQTALHKAALNGHLPIIKYLLPGKADVQARDADGWTALHNACSKVLVKLSDCGSILHPLMLSGLSRHCAMVMRTRRRDIGS